MSRAKSFPTLQVLATSIAAYEHNKRTIVRNPMTVDGVGYISNRQLVSDSVQGFGAPFVVNEFHTKQAEGIIAYLEQTVIMQRLKGATDRFLEQIGTILANSETTNKDFGIIAWAPHLADQYQKKDHVREVSARFEYSSRYIGQIGDKITTDFTLIDSRYIKTMDCYAVYGHDAQGNLIFYWAREQKKIIKLGKIHGRVKAQNRDQYRGDACVTTLNYVKIL